MLKYGHHSFFICSSTQITTGRVCSYFEPVERVEITKISLILTRLFHLERMISFLPQHSDDIPVLQCAPVPSAHKTHGISLGALSCPTGYKTGISDSAGVDERGTRYGKSTSEKSVCSSFSTISAGKRWAYAGEESPGVQIHVHCRTFTEESEEDIWCAELRVLVHLSIHLPSRICWSAAHNIQHQFQDGWTCRKRTKNNIIT